MLSERHGDDGMPYLRWGRATSRFGPSIWDLGCWKMAETDRHTRPSPRCCSPSAQMVPCRCAHMPTWLLDADMYASHSMRMDSSPEVAVRICRDWRAASAWMDPSWSNARRLGSSHAASAWLDSAWFSIASVVGCRWQHGWTPHGSPGARRRVAHGALPEAWLPRTGQTADGRVRIIGA